MKKKKSLVDIENDHSRSFMLGGHMFAIITFSIKSFSSFSILTNLIFLQLLLLHANLLLSLLIPSLLLFQVTCKCDFFPLNFICIYSATIGP
uniref:Transmembrane protein n=1 Tax=Populus trichocarpa TaxID=3694 RepID=A0A2K1WW86_POPTR